MERRKVNAWEEAGAVLLLALFVGAAIYWGAVL